MAIQPEAMAVDALRGYLLLNLPAKVTALNAVRKATLVSPRALTTPTPENAALRISSHVAGATDILIGGFGGSVSTLVNVINAELGALGLAGRLDKAGRLVIESATGVTDGDRAVVLGEEPEPGAYAFLGFDSGGNRAVRTPLVAPTFRCVTDGWPLMPEFQGNGVINVVIGDRTTQPWGGNVRSDQHQVDIIVTVMRATQTVALQTSREGIESSVRAIRELLNEDRRLGDPLSESGDRAIMLTEEVASTVSGRPLQFDELRGHLFDTAELRLRVRVYERAGT